MPCSDSTARNYLDDHRTQDMMREERSLRKQIDNLNAQLKSNKTDVEANLEKELEETRVAASEMAHKLNRQTELLCNATFILFEERLLNGNSKLQEWFNSHTEEDATRMKGELDKIMKRKNGTIQSLIKWYGTLDAKERWVFETHKDFKGIKLN